MSVNRYPSLQMAIHWLVVILVIVQWYTSDAIPRTRSPLFPPSDTQLLMASVHVYTGMVIGLLMVIRIGLRWARPMPAAQMPRWQGVASASVHWGLYLGLAAQAATGVAAYYFWKAATGLHAGLWNATLVLIGVHMAAAVYHIARRDGVVWRILPKIPW